MSITWLIIIIVIVIIICVIENIFYSHKIRYKFKCPNTYEIKEIETVDDDGDSFKSDILIYNLRYEKELKKKTNIEKYKYTYKPKILISSRIIKPFKDSVKSFKNIDKDTLITDTVEGFLPYVNYASGVLNNESHYRVMSNIPNLKITSNEDYIYIK